MPWIQLSFLTEPQRAARLSDLLTEVGAQAVTLMDAKNQPLYEPALGTTPLWDVTEVSGLFESASDISSTIEALRSAWAPRDLPAHRIETLEEADWTRRWMSGLHPMRFGERLWVSPDGSVAQDNSAVNVVLEPGLAFGTGTHPSTALCLEWLAGTDLEGRVLIDYGCGSGILSVAALKLGARHAWAVDIDSQALTATRENATRNGVPASISAVYPSELLPLGEVDFLVSNILVNTLSDLAPRFAALIKPGGGLFLAGMLNDQVASITQVYRHWFDLAPTRLRGDWAGVSATRKAADE